jgi:cytochrome c peroxidase
MNRSLFLLLFLFVAACKRDDFTTDDSQLSQPKPYFLPIAHFPAPSLPPDNPLTEEGILLGKMLFNDPILSRTGTQSCASCHIKAFAFTDTARFSLGVNGLRGERNSMSLANMAWNTNGFFWDGRAELLRHQVVMPIVDPLEMDENLPQVMAKLNAQAGYKRFLFNAFQQHEWTEALLAKALEQYVLSLVSNQSKYDRFVRGEDTLTALEARGRDLFFTEYNPFFPDISGADCAHCHSGTNFSNNQYLNNGLDAEGDWKDFGREKVTGRSSDRGKFKVTTLRNIALTAPYMSDGRFKTLEEVIDHYDHGIKNASTLDPALAYTTQTGLRLSEADKKALIAFLHTLTDSEFVK